MSWGERSCTAEKAPRSEHGGCSVVTMSNCNVNCKYYEWDGITKPDSVKKGKGDFAHKNRDRNNPCPCGSGLKFKKCCW